MSCWCRGTGSLHNYNDIIYLIFRTRALWSIRLYLLFKTRGFGIIDSMNVAISVTQSEASDSVWKQNTLTEWWSTFLMHCRFPGPRTRIGTRTHASLRVVISDVAFIFSQYILDFLLSP